MNANEIHLYLFPVAEQRLGWTEDFEAVLDAEERSRAAAFKIAEPRYLYRMAHLLVRLVLSRYTPIAPADWRFTKNEYGRPEIANTHGLAEGLLRFNLTHTQGLIGCAVVRTLPIGIDIERQRELTDLAALCDRILTAEETADVLSAGSTIEREQRFFAYWTLKEAYVKGRGMGFSLPVQQVAFLTDLGNRSTLHLQIDPALQDNAAAWQFDLFSLEEDAYSLSVGVQRGDRPDLPIRIYPIADPAHSLQTSVTRIGTTGDDGAVWLESPMPFSDFYHGSHPDP